MLQGTGRFSDFCLHTIDLCFHHDETKTIIRYQYIVMGEVATTTAAFRNQFSKASSSLHILRDGCDHNEVQKQYLASLKVQEVLQQYTPRLPKHVVAPLLLELARSLLQVNKRELALRHCYEAVLKLNLIDQPESSAYSVVDRTRHHVQALVGRATCVSGLACADDGTFQHQVTLEAVLSALQVCSPASRPHPCQRICAKVTHEGQPGMQDIKAGINHATRHSELSIAVFHATQQVHTLAATLIDAGFSQPALPYVVHASLAMESHTCLRLPRFLAWRCALVALVCRAYAALEQPDLAVAFIGRLVDGVKALEHTLAIDPVPHPHEYGQQIHAAKQTLAALKLQFSTAGVPEADLASSVQAGGRTALEQIEALLTTLSPPGRRCLDRSTMPASLAGAAAALTSTVMPLVATMKSELDAREAAARDQEQQAQAAATAATTDSTAPPESPADGTPAPSSTLPPWSDAYHAAAAALPPETLFRCVSVAFTFRLDDLFAALTALVAAQTNLAPPSASAAPDTTASAHLSALCSVLPAVSALESTPEADGAVAALRAAAAALQAAEPLATPDLSLIHI